jgi:Dehydratase family
MLSSLMVLSNSFILLSTNDLYNTSAGAFAVGKISDEERFDVVRHGCPGAGACGGMFTANTMSSALEVSFANATCCTVFELRQGTWHVLALFFEHACVVPRYLSAPLSFPCSDPDV